MMSKNELIKAAKLIKTWCKNNKGCFDCPLLDDFDECAVREPMLWEDFEEEANEE